MNRSIIILFFIFLILITYHRVSAQNEKNIPVTGDWESAGTIFQDENVEVELEFKLSKESCDSSSFGNSNHLFRYLITGLKKPLGIDKYLTFKIVYQDCFGRLICKTNNLNIGVKKKNDVWDGVQPISDPNFDNFFRGSKLIIPFMEVRTGFQKDASKDSECYKKTVTIPSGARTKKQQVSDQVNVVKNQVPVSTTLESNTTVSTNALPVSKSRKADLRIKGPQGNIVKGQKIRLELSDPGDNEWNWYEDSCNGTLLKTGSSFLDIIVLESTTFYAKPIVKISNKDICLNYHIFVDSTASLSVAPANIVVNNKGTVCKGDTAKLYPIGGSLGTDAAWYWYEKGKSDPLFIGDTLKFVPDKKVSIILKAKGKYNETEGVESTITVQDFDFANRKIVLYPDNAVCSNYPVTFKMEGPDAPIPMTWEWSTDKNVLLSIGTGGIIFSAPITTEIYATYRGCSDPKIYSKTYEVNAGSTLPTSYKVKQLGYNYLVNLKDNNLSNGSSWVLYNESKKKIKSFTESQFTVDLANNKYLLRAEGSCDTTEYFNLEVSETKKEVNKFYVNFGLSVYPSSPSLMEKTYVGTVGVLTSNGGWYFTVKNDAKTDDAEYTTNNVNLTNFPASLNSYYLYNGEVITNRLSAMFGLHKKISSGFYWNVGAGYGKRDVIWGINIKSMANGSFISKAYALNQVVSSSGLELGTGFTISVAPINFRVDVSMLSKNFKADNMLSELTFGIGLTF